MTVVTNLLTLRKELESSGVKLVAISKTKSMEEIKEVYQAGQRVFGENKVQELLGKYLELPKDIEWHLVGHLQSNKVKDIAPFIRLIHSVDSLRLLQEINKEALKNNRTIDCLLQLRIADEERKFGLDLDEAVVLLRSPVYQALKNIRLVGVMGIATHTTNFEQIKEEFYELAVFFRGLKESFFKNQDFFKELSMGMSADYKIAIEQGSTMVRLGSSIFGERDYPTSVKAK